MMSFEADRRECCAVGSKSRASDSALLPARYISNTRWRNSSRYVFGPLAMVGTTCTPNDEVSTKTGQLQTRPSHAGGLLPQGGSPPRQLP